MHHNNVIPLLASPWTWQIPLPRGVFPAPGRKGPFPEPLPSLAKNIVSAKCCMLSAPNPSPATCHDLPGCHEQSKIERRSAGCGRARCPSPLANGKWPCVTFFFRFDCVAQRNAVHEQTDFFFFFFFFFWTSS